MKKYIQVLILFLLITPVFAQENLNDNNIKQILNDWKSLNIYRTVDYDIPIAELAMFYTEKATKPIDIYDFSTGKKINLSIKKDDFFIVFAQTRFIVDKQDKNWTNFYVIKYQKNSNRFWDGLIKTEDLGLLDPKLLFLNCQFHYNNQSLASVQGESNKYSILYIFDNVKGFMKKTANNQQINKISFNPINNRSFKYISFIYNGEKPTNFDKYEFMIQSDEISFGTIEWDYTNDLISVNLSDPIDIYTGRKYIQK